jgi:ABC-type sugar transport system permease subunit
VREALEQSLGDLSIYVGLENFRIVLDDPVFRSAIVHNLYLLLCVPFMVAWALLVAVLLYEQKRGQRFFQFVIFIPYILSIPVIGLVFSEMLTKNGALNELLRGAGVGFLAQDWLGDPQLALVSIGAVVIWRESTLGALFFLARLVSLPTELFEAAKVDGASWFQMHRRLTVPLMRRVIALYALLAAITVSVWVFSYVFVLTSGGPGNATITTDLYVYQSAFGSGDQNIAAAAGTLLFSVAAALIVAASLVRSVARRWL